MLLTYGSNCAKPSKKCRPSPHLSLKGRGNSMITRPMPHTRYNFLNPPSPHSRICKLERRGMKWTCWPVHQSSRWSLHLEHKCQENFWNFLCQGPLLLSLYHNGMRDHAPQVNSEPWWNPLGRGLALATLPGLKVLNCLAHSI